MRILVTGGAGFLGSHLCDALIARGDDVVCLDDLSSGRRSNIAHLLAEPRFTFIEADVRTEIELSTGVGQVGGLSVALLRCSHGEEMRISEGRGLPI